MPQQHCRLLMDILEQVIRCANDLPTLRSLAVVCRDFVEESQKCLFETVELNTTEDDARSRRIHARFYSVISRRPHIAQYVREFVVRDISAEDDPPENERAAWIRDDPTFLHTLQILAPNLQRFRLETDLYWTSFPTPLQHSFRDLFSSPSLKYLSLLGLPAFPRSLCPAFRHLQELSLVGVEIDADSADYLSVEEADARSLNFIHLEDVTPESFESFTHAMYPPGLGTTTPFLETIYVGPQTPEEATAVCNLIRAARQSLKSLHWEYLLRSELPPPIQNIPLNLSEFPRLYWLTFEVSASQTPGDDDYFAGLITLLRTTAVPSGIRRLHFTVFFPNSREASTSIRSHQSWEALSVVLDDQRFPSLTDVYISIRLDDADEMDVDEVDVDEMDIDDTGGDPDLIEQLLGTRLRNLDERGVLNVTVH